MKAITALLMLSVALPIPASAADGDDDPVVKARAVETARIQAETAQIQARTAQIAARMAALGLTNNATGTTTLQSKGGELEAWMLSAQAIDMAAQSIAETVGKSRRPVVLLDSNEPFDLSVYAVVKARLDALETRVDGVLDSDACKPVKGGGMRIAVASIIPLAGAILGLLKTDTDIYGVEAPTSARLLVNAIAQRSGTWIVPTDLSQIPMTGPLATEWDSLKSKRGSLTVCAAALTGDAGKPTLAAVTAVSAAVDEFETQAVAAGGTASLFIQAVRAETITLRRPLVLRLFVEKAGGTILLRKNLWTALGAPAVGISGGAIVGWRLTEPTSGVATGGMLRCHTALSNLRAIQSGSVADKVCVSYR